MKQTLLIILTCALMVNVSFAQRNAVRTPGDSQAKAQAPTLEDQIRDAVSGFNGKVWIYAKNLDTGREFSLRGDEKVRTASTIKLPIMTEAFRQVAEGKLKWDDVLTVSKESKVSGSGILGEFSDGTKIDLRTAVNLMIVVSDNTATNLVLDKVTADSVNDYMDKLGLPATRSMRKVLGGGDSKALQIPENRLFGLGSSTPREMVRLLEMLEKGEVVSKQASDEMLVILRRQQFKEGIGRNQVDTTPVASKSGALDRLRSDVGIVYTRRGRIAMAITVDDMPVVQYITDNPGSLMIWKLSQILQEGLGR